MSGATYISLGNIGIGIVRALRVNGIPVTAWNRTSDRPHVKTAVSLDATFEPDVAKAIAANRLIIICTLSYATLKEIFSSVPDGHFKDKVLVNFTTGTPGQAAEMSAWVHSKGAAAYFDGAITAVPHQITGDAGGARIFIVGGETPETYATISPVLRGIGPGDYIGSDVSASSRMDLAGITAMYGMFNGSFLAMALLKSGSKEQQIQKAVAEAVVPMLQHMVVLLPILAQRWDEENFDESDGNSLGMQLSGLENLKGAYRDAGIDFSPMERFFELMEEARKTRGDDAGTASVGPLLFKK